MSTQPYTALQVDANQGYQIGPQHAHSKPDANANKTACKAKTWSHIIINLVVFSVGVIFGAFAIPQDCPSCIPTSAASANSPNTTLSPTANNPSVSPTNLPTTTTAVDAHLEEMQWAKSIASSLGLDQYASLFDPQNDAYFDHTLDDYTVHGGRVTATAKGWVKLGLNTAVKGYNDQDLSNWSIAYHGNQVTTIVSIFASNLTLLKTGDAIPGTNTSVTKPANHIQEPFERYNEYTNQTELFDPEQVFMTPSILFASLYATNALFTGEWSGDMILYRIVFEAAFRNVSDSNIGQTQTTGYVCSDGVIQYNQIEWYTRRNLEDIVLTGMLFQMRKVHTWKGYSSTHFTLYGTSSLQTVRRTAVDSGSVLSPVTLETVNSGYHEWNFRINAVSNQDQIRFGLVDETNAVYWWSAAGKKRYSRHATTGFSYYAHRTICSTKCWVIMRLDLYKYEVRFVVNSYFYDVAWQLPQRAMNYTPTVWMGNEGDEVMLN